MTSIARAIIDTCARANSQYGFSITSIRLRQSDYDRLRAEPEYTQYFELDSNGSVVKFADVVIEVERA